MWTDLGEGYDAATLRTELTRTTPMGRFGDPAEVAMWACNLLDPGIAGWMTGSLIPVDGGRTA
jgi:NAD(P)-dependent dehydrogenase (short-subunit alcohol dehydrogenase family)